MSEKYIIIGLDGGATKVSGWLVNYAIDKNEYSLTGKEIETTYSSFSSYDPEFQVIPINQQLEQYRKNNLQLTNEEINQGNAYLQASLEVISKICHQKKKKIILGIGMPGLKTENKRGIAVLANGPRNPFFLDLLEDELKKKGIELMVPVSRLGSDADYCGIGEEYADAGLFKASQSAYYLGGGTGVADALKLKGELLPFDNSKEWIAKSWELKNNEGLSLEKCISARGIQELYSTFSGASIEKLNDEKIYGPQILHLASKGDVSAKKTIQTVNKNLACLIFERIITVHDGWKGFFNFVNPNKSIELKKHPYLGTRLEKIIIGQRLGDLLEISRKTQLMWPQILNELTSLFLSYGNDSLSSFYLEDNKFRSELIQVSSLRAAPALGAAVDAYLAFKKRKIC